MGIINQIQLLGTHCGKENSSSQKQEVWGLKGKEGIHAGWDDVSVSFPLPMLPAPQSRAYLEKF